MSDNIPSTRPERPHRRAKRVALGGIGLAGLLCCAWVFYRMASAVLPDFAFILVPAGVMAAIVIAVVVGWRAGVLKRWSRTRIVVAGLALVMLVPAAVIGGWVVKATVAAGRGAPCPLCAVDEYVWNVLTDPIRLRNFLCADRRQELGDEAGRWRTIYLAALERWRLTARLEIGAADDRVNGAKATVTMPVEHTHERRWQDGGGVASRKQISWTFDVVEEGGWRVCGVGLPDVCTEVILCDGPGSVTPSTAPTPVPSFRPWSDWDTTVRWECFPDAGVWRRPGCPTPPTGWTQPGPVYCAPTFPEMSRDRQQTAHCRKLGWDVDR